MSTIETIAADIDARFKSLNSVPVSDVRLTRTEWSAIKQAVMSHLTKPDAEPVAYQMQYVYPNGGVYYIYASKHDANMTFGNYLTAKTPLYANPPQDTAEREALVAEIDGVFALNGSYEFRLLQAHKALGNIRAYLTGGGA